jgi:hypothetical protein
MGVVMKTNRRSCGRIASLLLSLFICGCNLPLWGGGGHGPHVVDGVGNYHGAPGYQTKVVQPLDQPTQLPEPRVLPPNERISLMSQQLANAEDNRKVLAGRLQMVETQLAEKEKALAAATQEIQETTAQVVKTRNELQTWQKDMKNLRDKYGALEKDNRETLETMIKTLEMYLDREKMPAKGPDISGPELLPLPKHK